MPNTTDIESLLLIIAQLRAQNTALIAENQQLKDDNATLKDRIPTTDNRPKNRRKKSAPTLQQAHNRIRTRTLRMKRRDMHKMKYEPEEEMRKTGLFDSFGTLKGYERAAQAAGNRIESKHPGFYSAVKDLPGILRTIWEIYGAAHTDKDFYETHGNDYVDEEAYETLLLAINYKYNVEILV